MTRRAAAMCAALLFGQLAIAAGPPVALRVELAPVGSVADTTAMLVTIQVAPEDRDRLGRDVWVQGELLRRGERVDRLARALDVNEQGQARFETAWPPGSYELRLELKGAQRDVSGIWIGPITVPEQPAEGEAMTPEPAGAAGGAAAAGAAAAGGATAVTEKPRPATATAGAEDPKPAASPPEAPAPATPEAVAPQPAAPAVTPPAEPEPVPVEPPVREPEALPAEPPLTAPQAEPSEPPAAVPEPDPAPAAVPSRGPTPAGWGSAAPGSGDVTVVVTERNRPILGLGPSAFDLRVAGDPVPLDAVGDASSAPLNLALVVHLSSEAEEAAGEIVRQLGALALRARSGGDLLVVTPADPEAAWGASADDLARAIAGPAGSATGSLAGLVSRALDAYDGRRGRSFLVVVTDGQDESERSAWKDAVAAAERAGVPVLAVGLRDRGFSDRARSSLAKMAEATGGRAYFLGDAGVVGMTLDYLGELVDASYALPYGATSAGGPRDVKVEVTNREWEVAHPRRIP